MFRCETVVWKQSSTYLSGNLIFFPIDWRGVEKGAFSSHNFSFSCILNSRRSKKRRGNRLGHYTKLLQ